MHSRNNKQATNTIDVGVKLLIIYDEVSTPNHFYCKQKNTTAVEEGIIIFEGTSNSVIHLVYSVC